MPEEVLGSERYLSLKDVSKILNKKEAALRARIKRGNLDAVQTPMGTSKEDSKRFRYMIPLDAVKEELAGMVRHEPALQTPLEDGDDPNLYQIFCEIFSKNREGLTSQELRWHLERYHGLSLSEESVAEFLLVFSEFHQEQGVYSLRHPILFEIHAHRSASGGAEHARTGERAAPSPQEALRQLDQRINALESKIELLIQLLSNRFS